MLPRASACGGPDCVSSKAIYGLPLESTLSIGVRGEVVDGLMPAPEESPGICSTNALPLHRRAYRAIVLPLMLTVTFVADAETPVPVLLPAPKVTQFDPLY